MSRLCVGTKMFELAKILILEQFNISFGIVNVYYIFAKN